MSWSTRSGMAFTVRARSAEVPRARRCTQGEEVETLGDHVGDTFAALEAAPDEHRRRRASDPPEPGPAALRAHDVDEPGLVLEVEERRARRRRRSLPVGD